MKKFGLLLALAGLFFMIGVSRANAQGAISSTDSSVKLDYPTQMTFHLAASSSAPITVVNLVVRFPASGLVNRLQPKFSSGPKVDISQPWILSGKLTTSSTVGGYLPVGAKGEYNWHIEDQAGNKLDTPAKPFMVDDNRQNWTQFKNDRIVLYWGGGSESDGKTVFDKANTALNALQSDIGATVASQVRIFIWGTRDDFMSALQPGSQEWAGGTIDPTFNVVLIDGSEGMDFVLEATPHELTHVVVHQYIKGPYGDSTMPHWLDEGLAVYHEYVPPKDRPSMDTAVRRAAQTDSLMRLRSLDSQFPADAQLADLAYGEAFSVVDFMIHTFGADKVKQVMTLFKNGTTADDAFQQVLGVDEDGLENQWRKSIGAQVKTYTKAATPTAGAVPTFGFSSAETPSGAATTPATATPAAVAQASTPIPSSNSAPAPSSSSGGGGLCGLPFGGAAVLLFGVWQLWVRKK